MPITHAFTNPKSDGGDTTVTRPSDWNADHVYTMTTPGTWVGYGPRANSNFTSNRAYYARLVIPFALTPNRIGLAITTSSGNLDLGLYADDGTGQNPGSRLFSLGSTASPGTGTRLFTISPGLISAGVYWLAFSCDNGTLAAGYIGTGTGNGEGGAFALVYQDSAFPLPSSAASLTKFSWAAAVWLEIV